ncbi:hypothetical protein CYMTET_7522 [Cymbomonas tetramitiformis]|uniref:Uncharacterized protein n=1 Tax=Cymbomonas tetramitiformis TaxID=36881 RepID=A0AAE0LHF0_9CHLO|nr:hypothetical protein CYMTET_7522 [Cymbomonas tetramitiformis]
MTTEDLMKWYRGEDRFAVYVLVSPWTSLSYVGKSWNGVTKRSLEHLQVTQNPSKRGARKLYGFLRSYGIFNYVCLPLAFFRSKTDTDTAELRLIRLTQHPNHTLNTQGFRRQRSGPTKKKQRSFAHLRGRTRRPLQARGEGNNFYDEGQTALTVWYNEEWNGTNLMTWLAKFENGDLLLNSLKSVRGLIDGSDWDTVRTKFGKSESTVTWAAGDKISSKLGELAKQLKHNVAAVVFEKIYELSRDRWANWVVKGLIRRPATCPVLFKFTLEQLVRVFEAIRSYFNWQQRASLRAKVALAASRAHGFPLRGVYVLRVPAATTWDRIDLKSLARAALRHLKLSWRVTNFVTRRTTVVQTRTRKLDSTFCNFRELAARTTAPPCMCHTASPSLPRDEEGHVCARTTDLSDTVLAPLAHSLKDTPAFSIDCQESAREACLDYVNVFAGYSTKCEDEKVDAILPLLFEVEGCSYNAVKSSERTLQAKKVKGVATSIEQWTVWFTVRRGNCLVMRVLWTRMKRLVARLAAMETSGAVATGSLRGYLIFIAQRMVFWVDHITRDYWIFPYPDQDVLRSVLTLTAELFATPFDVNLKSTVFFTPYEEDTAFAAGLDAHSYWWQLMAFGNPLYTRRCILRAIQHAVDSARGARTAVRIVLTVPAWEDYTKIPFVHRFLQLKRDVFRFLAPQSALGYEDRSTGARFDVDVLLIQNAAAKRQHPVTAGGLARLGRHFRGRLKQGPNYSESWVAPFCAARASLNEERWDVEPLCRQLVTAARRMKVAAELQLKLRGSVQRWAQEQGVPAGRTDCTQWGTVNVAEYRLALAACELTARFPLDRNGAVGGLMCQRKYFQLLVKERETSAAQFEKIDGTVASVMEKMSREFNAKMLHTVARFDANGFFGTLYVLIKDKCNAMQLYRPIQPNYSSPIALAQNRLGRAADFIVDALGSAFTLGGTHRLKGRIADFNARAAKGAHRVYGATFDVKDRFSNVDHDLATRAITATVDRWGASSSVQSVLVKTRGRRGVCLWTKGVPTRTAVRITRAKLIHGLILSLRNNFIWIAGVLVRQTRGVGMGGRDSPSVAGLVCAYGEREFSESLRADAYFINLMQFMRQADDCLVLVIFMTGTPVEWAHIRGILRRYRDGCYIAGMRVLQTGGACTSLCTTDRLEFCGMEVSFAEQQCGIRPMTQNEKRGSLGLYDTPRAFPFVNWASTCTRARKFITLIGALHRIFCHSSHELLMLIALTKLEMELLRAGYPTTWLRDGIFAVAGSTALDFWQRTASRVRQHRLEGPTSLPFLN